MNWQERVHVYFPAAKCLPDVRGWLLEQLEGEYGGDRGTTLLCTSTCSDDIIATKDIGQDFWGPFELGGLGGLPFGGRTAISAYAHHIPDQGTALIMYGPHIGVTKQGVWGKMLRAGQSRETASCGALMAALDKMKNEDGAQPYLPFDRDDDQQQVFLERSLMPYKQRILDAESPEKEITDVTYALIHRQVQQLIDFTRDRFHGDRIVYLGGVFINTDPDDPDWLDVRDHGVIKVVAGR